MFVSARMALAVVSAALFLSANASAQTVIDLTHPIPTFHSVPDNPAKPDLSKPWSDIGAYPIYGEQAVLWLRQIPTNQGYIESGRLTLWEHQGTHMDAPSHFVNNAGSIEPAGVPPEKRKQLYQVDAKQLVGPVAIIDISERVRQELGKNGGRPSPDKKVTDFSDSSRNVVTPEDVEAIADKIEDGTWLVLNLGWSQFYFGEMLVPKSPYINGFNHPGLSRKATDKLIEIMDRKKVKISGIVADNIAIESGQVAHGDDDKRTNALHAHVRLLQREILIVENANNLDKLTEASKRSRCTLVVGAVKLVHGTGGPARVLALCN